MKCAGPKCKRDAKLGKFCGGHYRQLRRAAQRGAERPEKELKPLRIGRGVKLAGLTVSEACAKALAARGPTTYEAAKGVLEAWARRKT